MNGTHIQLQTADGVAETYVSHPDGAGPWPAIVSFMDGVGFRAAMFAMADRLAGLGYFVVLPDLFYRSGAFTPPDPKLVFGGKGPEFEQVLARVNALDDARSGTSRLSPSCGAAPHRVPQAHSRSVVQTQ